MSARMALSAISGGFRLLIRSWLAMRRGKHLANEGVKIFRRTLQEQGLPKPVINELTAKYRANADFLSLRNLSQFAFQTARSQPRRE